MRKVLEGPPPPILSRAAGAPPQLVRVAEWAMARELRDRYAAMDDVVRDLERVAEGHDPLGPRASQRISRRWRAPLWAAALTLAAVLAAWRLRPADRGSGGVTPRPAEPRPVGEAAAGVLWRSASAPGS